LYINIVISYETDREKMDIRKLEAFAKVFEHRSFSKAGKALYLSQPTISAHVAFLEKELGVSLFDRIGRLVVPTKAGELLYTHARKIFDISDQAISEIHCLQSRVTGRLELGGSTIPANYILPGYLAQFWRKYPEVTIELQIGDSEEIVAQVQESRLMLGVVGGTFGGPDLEYVTPELRAEYADETPEQLVRKLPWVMREEGSGTRAAMETALARQGLSTQELQMSILVRNAGAMARCLEAGMGAGITSAVTVREALRAGRLTAVTWPGLHMERSFYVVFHKKRSLFPAAAQLIEFLKTTAKNIEDFS
jgi:DNA-binding transcriptional LysR family regulator